MSRWLWSALTANPVVLGASLLAVNSTFAAPISNLEPVFVQTDMPFSENSIHSEKLAAVLVTQNPDTQAEEPQFSAFTPLENSSSEELWVNKTLNAPPLASETLVGQSTSEDLELVNDDRSDQGTDDSMEQITNVSQLSDVSPGDWAYEALRKRSMPLGLSLVERYGYISGYPDGTFRGNRAMTRFEFAAGLSACLQQVERLIASSTSEFVRREDLETLQRMVQEFQTELAILGTRVDTLEGRVAFLEDHQFSVTTRLIGSVDFGLIDAWGDKKAVPSGQRPTEDLNVNTFFPGRAGLVFDTSFTGRDLLRTKLEAGNFTPLDASITGTDMTLYDFDTRTGPTGNDIVLATLLYKFPIGDRIGSPVLVGITQAYNLAPSRFSASILPKICIKNYILPQASGRA